jgi:tetratricopeptide (TPR) repeat protein
VAVVGVATALLLAIGGILGGQASPSADPASPDAAGSATAPAPATATATDRLDAAIDQTQQRLRRVPADHRGWAALGTAYLERARVTADPGWYGKAEGALRRSLAERPAGNPAALAGLAALANARHEFAEARKLARQALRLNRFDPEAYGVLADAETQLGHPAAATEAVQRMLDLRPGLPALARAAYDREQHGRTGEAQRLMRRALAAAFDPADVAFCRHRLGELAWHAGDLAGAEAHYTAGIAADPSYLPLRHGLARVAAARGDLAAATAGYAELTSASPTPDYLLEYAELLRAAGRDGEADRQLALAEAAHQLFTASGGTDDLAAAELALARSRPAAAVRLARQEWQRRQFADVADTLGWALHQAGRDAEAVSYARRAGALGARNAGYAFHLGMIELALGNRAAARTQLARALDINPHFSPRYAPVAARTLADLES